MRPATLKRFLRHEGFGELLELHRLDCLASSGRLGTYEYARAQWEGLSPEELRPAPLVTGRDVMALGVAPGPRIGELLRALEEEQLEGNVSTREEALAWLSRQAGGRAST
jgi:poly(A) polymerase